MLEGYVYLNYANGWESTPEVVERARKLGYKERILNDGRGVDIHVCDELKFYYKVDHS